MQSHRQQVKLYLEQNRNRKVFYPVAFGECCLVNCKLCNLLRCNLKMLSKHLKHEIDYTYRLGIREVMDGSCGKCVKHVNGSIAKCNTVTYISYNFRREAVTYCLTFHVVYHPIDS